MKVIFDHREGFGKVEKQDFIYNEPKGIPTSDRYLDYLNEGWIEWGDYWYNLRSVRIDTENYKPSKTIKRLSNKITFKSSKVVSKEDLKDIYESYVSSKGFSRDINLDMFLGYEALLFYHNGNLIGATIFKIYNQDDSKAMVSYQFLWDYKTPSLSLGGVSQFYEVQYAKQIGAKHVYLLGGYEVSSIYKSSFKGFEWFTGEGWSDDKEEYTILCERDSKTIVSYGDI